MSTIAGGQTKYDEADMKKFLPSLVLVSLYFILPGAVEAQGGFVTCNGTDCGTCELVDMTNNIIIWLFGLVGMVFAVMMMIAGFGLITSRGNTSALEAAKSKFVNAIIGLVIMMAAWLLVDTLLKRLLKDGNLEAVSAGWGPWNEVQCTTQMVTFSRSGRDTINENMIEAPIVPSAGSLSHVEGVALLGSNFQVRSTNSCTNRNDRLCTSLDGVKPLTIQRMKEFQSQVGVPIIITGGTEAGHAAGTYSHANGYKIDISTSNSTVNRYIQENFTPLGGSKWKDDNGNIFYRHGPPDHWDITITR